MKLEAGHRGARARFNRTRRGIAKLVLGIVVAAVAGAVVLAGLFGAGILKLNAGGAGAKPNPVPTVTMGPASGPINTEVSINLTGLGPNSTYTVYFSIVPGSLNFLMTTFTTSTAGTTPGSSDTFSVPSGVPSGAYYVDVVSRSTGVIAPIKPTEFTVTLPSATIFPTSGTVGADVAIYGTGLAPNELYFVCFDPIQGVSDYLVTTVHSNATGVLSALGAPIVFTVPPGEPAGTYSVDIFGPNNAFIVHASSPFTLLPTDVLFGPTQGPVGTVVMYSTVGLQPNTKYNLSLDSHMGILDDNLTAFVTDKNGNSSGMFKVPVGTVAFTYYVDVQPVKGGLAITASRQFKVTETSVTISPSSGPVNTSVSINAPDLAPNTAYTLAFDKTPGVLAFPAANITAIYNGTLNGTFNVPTIVPVGQYSVDLFQSQNASYTANASSPFTVTSPQVTISPTMGPGNTSILVSATGMAPKTSYNAFFSPVRGGTGVFVASITTAGDGSYAGRFTVPQYILVQATNYLNLFQGSTGTSSYGTYITSASSPFSSTGGIPSVMTSPASGPVGTLVTLNATGLLANAAYNIDFYQTQTQTYISYVVGTIKTDPNGVYNGTFTVPSYVNRGAVVPQGAYYVALLEQNSYWALPVESSIFTVTTPSSVAVQAAAISPSIGAENTLVSLTGVGLQPGTMYRACLNLTTLPGVNGYLLTTFTTAVNGSFNTNFIVPRNAVAGTYYVNLFQVSTGTYNLSAQTQFTVTPDWAISPILHDFFGPANTSVFFSAFGLVPTTQYNVYFDLSAGSTAYFVATFMTPSSGNFSGAFYVPPYVPAGIYEVDLFGTAAGYIISASNSFTVTSPFLSISPISGPGHTSISLVATGFAPTILYRLELDATPRSPDFLFGGFRTAANGSFYGTVNQTTGVPAGPYSVDVFTYSSVGPPFITTASSMFTMTTPILTIRPTVGPVGAQLLLLVSGLAPSTDYNVDFDIQSGVIMQFVTSFITSGNGSFYGMVTVPANVPAGSYWVDFFEAKSGNSISFPEPAKFKVNAPSLTMGPTSGGAGTLVTATAAWFAASDTSVLVTGPTGATLCMITVSPAGSGNGTCQFTGNSSNGFTFSTGGARNTVTGTGTPTSDVAVATFTGTSPMAPQPTVSEASGGTGTHTWEDLTDPGPSASGKFPGFTGLMVQGLVTMLGTSLSSRLGRFQATTA